MPGGGLIFAAILVGWAVFLLPQWLRRDAEIDLDDFDDDEQDETRPAPQSVPAERAPSPRQEPWAASPRRASGLAQPSRPQRAQDEQPWRATGAAQRKTSRRRRRALVLIVLLTAAGWLVPGAPLSAALAGTGLLAGYLMLLLVAGRRAARVRRTPEIFAGRQPYPAVAGSPRRASGTAAGMALPTRGVGTAAGSVPADDTATGQVPAIVEHTLSPATGAVTAAAQSSHAPGYAAAARSASTGLDPSLAGPEVPAAPAVEQSAVWMPISVPLPTYLTAPKARRTIRTIDLSAPGTFTSGRLDEGEVAALAASGAAAASAAREEELREAGRRAVGS